MTPQTKEEKLEKEIERCCAEGCKREALNSFSIGQNKGCFNLCYKHFGELLDFHILLKKAGASQERQRVQGIILEIKKKILEQRRYLPSQENIGTMNYWVGNDDDNRGIYVDLGGIIGKINELLVNINKSADLQDKKQ